MQMAEAARALRSGRRRRLLRVGIPLYVTGLAAWTLLLGFPVARAVLLPWIVLGLVVLSLGDPSRVRRVVVDWAPFALVLFTYDLLRGISDGLLVSAKTWPQIRADELLFGQVPTVWLQGHLWHGAGDLHWYDFATWLVYVSHFFATLLLAATLWVLRSARFRRYISSVCLLAALSFATYVLFPAVPPWMASQHGDLGPVDRTIDPISGHIPFLHLDQVFERGTQIANDVAAMPSLHAAAALLVTLTLWHFARRWIWRALLALYPLAMSFALVYSGEHYVIDCLVGFVYAIAAYLVVERVAERRSRRPSARAAAAGSGMGPGTPELASELRHHSPHDDVSTEI
ncbi:MAG: phosphatase PAP2 family protein [Gaiellaceae bacterium]